MLSFLGGWERQVQIILIHFLPFVSTEHNPESQSATAFHPLNPSASPFNNSLPPHPRLRLIHGFLPPEEADWAFSKLLAELPWSQKTNYRQGRSTIMSPRIDHRAILYTAYRREQTDFFFLWVPCWHWKCLPIRMLLSWNVWYQCKIDHPCTADPGFNLDNTSYSQANMLIIALPKP